MTLQKQTVDHRDIRDRLKVYHPYVSMEVTKVFEYLKQKNYFLKEKSQKSVFENHLWNIEYLLLGTQLHGTKMIDIQLSKLLRLLTYLPTSKVGTT